MWNFTQIANQPLIVDTGIDDLDGDDILLRINAAVIPVEPLLEEFRERGE